MILQKYRKIELPSDKFSYWENKIKQNKMKVFTRIRPFCEMLWMILEYQTYFWLKHGMSYFLNFQIWGPISSRLQSFLVFSFWQYSFFGGVFQKSLALFVSIEHFPYILGTHPNVNEKSNARNKIQATITLTKCKDITKPWLSV